jgi:hypothetical protein
MLHRIPFKFAIKTMLILLFLVFAFHLLVLTELIPYTIVWGGKFQNITQMRRFELVSVIINPFMICVLAIKGNYISVNIPVKVINIILWLFVVLFALNTIGNLFAATLTETLVFAPLTFISALLCFRIVMERYK